MVGYFLNDVPEGSDLANDIRAAFESEDTFTYLDCFPTRYVFPALSASGTGNLYQTIDHSHKIKTYMLRSH